MTWLLVEDDPDIRNVVAVMMQLWGEKALALADGNAAWKWLDTVEAGSTSDLPDLALMDIRMPGHTGDQIAERIRKTESLRGIPIILMTAFTLSDNEAASMMARAGVDHLIKKPLPDMDVFKSTLYNVREEKRKQKPAPAAPSSPPTPAVSGATAEVKSAAATPATIVAPPPTTPTPTPVVSAAADTKPPQVSTVSGGQKPAP